MPTGAPTSTAAAPGLTVGGFTIGDAGTPTQWQVTNSFIWQDTVACTHGRDSLRAGVEVKRHQVGEEIPFSITGLLQIATFNDFLIGQSAAQNGSPLGLSNITFSNAGGGLFRRNERYTDFAAFTQDDFKLTPRLTLNMGVRYEIFARADGDQRPPREFQVATAATRPYPATRHLQRLQPAFELPRHAARGLYTRHRSPASTRRRYGDVSPRLGVVWQVTQKPVIVLRGGYGIYFDRHSGNLAEQTMDQMPFATQQFVAGGPNAGGKPAESLRAPDSPELSLSDLHAPHAHVNSVHRVDQPEHARRTHAGIQPERPVRTRTRLRLPGRICRHAIVAPLRAAGVRSGSAGQPAESDQRRNHQLHRQRDRAPSVSGPEPGLAAHRLRLRRQLQRTANQPAQANAAWLPAPGAATPGRRISTKSTAKSAPMFSSCSCPRTTSSTCATPPTGPPGPTAISASSPTLPGRRRTSPSAPRCRATCLIDWQFSGIGLIQTGIPLSVFDTNAGSVYGLIARRSPRPAHRQQSPHARLHVLARDQWLSRSGRLHARS